jgi:hypothetical protein
MQSNEMIYLIWAEKGEYSDMQTKVVCYFKTREEAEKVKETLQEKEPLPRSRWDAWDHWRYSVEECAPGVTFE